jgi:DNA-binding transcriptional ArsR family regulator
MSGGRFTVSNAHILCGEPVEFANHEEGGFFPFCDKYGQFVHSEWPGKIHSDGELVAARSVEADWLHSHAMSPIGDADRFGGCLAGTKLTATGKFRVEKTGGRWHLVDPDGYLFKDFDRIFDDVFGGSVQAKKRILSLLAEKPASVSELAAEFGSDPNGHLSENLSELEEAGFIAGSKGTNPITGKRIREVRYRLRDNYTRFYLRYILPKKETIANGFYQYVPLDRLPGWDAIMGLQFENLVLNNIASLAPHIGLIGKNVESAAPYFKSGRKTGRGVQIDYLVQLPKCTYVIEIKRKHRITAAIEDEMQEKLNRLKLPRDRSVKLVLVYAGELDPAVDENGFFDYLVPADRLLGRSLSDAK